MRTRIEMPRKTDARPAATRSREGLPGDAFEVLGSRLYAGPYPSSLRKDEATAKASALLNLGVTHFVDLTEAREKGRRGNLYPYAPLVAEVAAEKGLKIPQHTRVSIPDLSVPTVEQMHETLELIETSVDRGDVVYFHCWGGVGRTGTVLGCLLINRGTPHDEVFDVIADLRADTSRSDRQAPETEEQREFVLNWNPGTHSDGSPE
jgi:hypothetical protein